MSLINKILKLSGLMALLTVMTAALSVLYAGVLPRNATGWTILFLMAAPLWLAGEWIGGKVLSERMSRRIDASEKALSLKRMAYAFAVMLVACAITTAIWIYTKEFWESHFHLF